MQVEDRGADLLNDLLKVVDTVGKPLLHLGRACSRNGSLQCEADGEQALDDVIVQVAGDAVAVGQDVELAHLALRAGQLPRQRGLVGEGSHHVELVGAEGVSLRPAAAPPGRLRPQSVARSGSTSAGPVAPISSGRSMLSNLPGVR